MSDIRELLIQAWQLGAATAYARRDRPQDYAKEGRTDEQIAEADVERVLETADCLPIFFPSGQLVEDAARYAVHGGAGFDTAAERLAAELGARRAISLLIGEVGMFDPAFVSI